MNIWFCVQFLTSGCCLLENFSEFPHSKNSEPRKRFFRILFFLVASKEGLRAIQSHYANQFTLAKTIWSHGCVSVFPLATHLNNHQVEILFTFLFFVAFIRKKSVLFQSPLNWLIFVRLVKKKEWNSLVAALFLRFKPLSLEKCSLFVFTFFFRMSNNGIIGFIVSIYIWMEFIFIFIYRVSSKSDSVVNDDDVIEKRINHQVV